MEIDQPLSDWKAPVSPVVLPSGIPVFCGVLREFVCCGFCVVPLIHFLPPSQSSLSFGYMRLSVFPHLPSPHAYSESFPSSPSSWHSRYSFTTLCTLKFQLEYPVSMSSVLVPDSYPHGASWSLLCSTAEHELQPCVHTGKVYTSVRVHMHVPHENEGRRHPQLFPHSTWGAHQVSGQWINFLEKKKKTWENVHLYYWKKMHHWGTRVRHGIL